MRMQIPTTHKTALRRVRMYPAQHHQTLRITELEQRILVCHFTGVGRAFLFGYYEPRDEEGVGHKGAAEHAAGLEVVARVAGGYVEKGFSEVGGQEETAEGIAVLEVGGGVECVFFCVIGQG